MHNRSERSRPAAGRTSKPSNSHLEEPGGGFAQVHGTIRRLNRATQPAAVPLLVGDFAWKETPLQ